MITASVKPCIFPLLQWTLNVKGGEKPIDHTEGTAADPACWLEMLHRPVGQKAFVVLRTADRQILRTVKNLIIVRLASHAAYASGGSPVISMWEEAELAKLRGVLDRLIPEDASQ